jgi:nicotinate-nucleotide pyrophosphorylase (carboxylating)
MTIDEIITLSLAEDTGDGDHTTLACIPSSSEGSANLLVKADGVLCGLEVAAAVFRKADPGLHLNKFFSEGDEIRKGDIVFSVSGKISSILVSERSVLNFMQRMSGIATATRKLVDQVHGLPVRILDTRKTTPLLRELEKMAVRTGGGYNHRMGLYDMIMIKDNHIDFAGGIEKAIDSVKTYLSAKQKSLKIEIEVRNFTELKKVLDHEGIDRIMLDNFSPGDLAKAVSMIAGKYETEASGGIHEGNIRKYAETGVDFISVGALTHHIMSLDMSLKAVKPSVSAI